MDIIQQLSKELSIRESQTIATVKLIDEGNTIPFIARYRKEVTGELSDIQLRDLGERLTYLRNLEKRKQEVTRLIGEMGKLDDELEAKIQKAATLQLVEDLYRPYKPKKRTRATIAKEKGLEPLSDVIWLQMPGQKPLLEMAAEFVDEEKGVSSIDDAINGALDIIAEVISDDADVRKKIREMTFRGGSITSKKILEGDVDFTIYHEYSEPIHKIPSHRILALNRGENGKAISVSVDAPSETITNAVIGMVIIDNSPYRTELEMTAKDSYDRLIRPSMEREMRAELSEKAETQAIKVFMANLRSLLLMAPVKGKTIMGFDPAYRTGCKIAVLDETGKLLDISTVYPTQPFNKVAEAKDILLKMIRKHNVQLISIGNGTASRESELFCAEMAREYEGDLKFVVVNEAGASVYSASELASKEYPDINVSIRGAISIARRLQDPLAELVKIDPKSIGVGQYQHDVNQKKLSEGLTGVVEDCVNSVGVDLNTASPSLLSYVAGVNSSIASNIVAYRDEMGSFKSRKELLKVKKLGAKTFEQCAGFLRIIGGKELLDGTSVHPESYDITKKLLVKAGLDKKVKDLKELVQAAATLEEEKLDTLAKEMEIGVPTLKDILSELKKPGRDPREEMAHPIFMSDVMEIKDLVAGMELTGTVRNVIDFGAFIDIGVHQDGLVHISEMADKFIKHPLDVVKTGDIVKVRVLAVDIPRKRISLTMKA